ncbi:MAG: DUF6599 family protein [Bacteroidales bacterium]|nr:DUF6599 family protein [Bacteroidales bacterium]
MKRLFAYLLGLFVVLNLPAQGSIYNLIYFGDCREISLSGEAELYVGNDLFSLINGGAELYHEFGFVEVLAMDLAVEDKGLVRAEIYDMGSSEGAWGIYSLTATTNAKNLGIGDAARTGKGFMQLIKDRYMIYLYSESLEKAVLEKVLSCIAANIPKSSLQPALLKAIGTYAPEEAGSKYFSGNLGLSGIYAFHYKDVFDYEEGVAAVNEGTIAIVLKYKNEDKCLEKFNASYDFFSQRNKYHDQEISNKHYHLKDRKEQHLNFFCNGKYMLIFIHDGSWDVEQQKELLMDKLPADD